MHRVLVVDDAVVVRRMLARIVDSDPHLEAVGTAANGRIGLNKLRRCTPDAVVLDLEMPEMDGFEMLREIRAESLELPVPLLEEALELGARVGHEVLGLRDEAHGVGARLLRGHPCEHVGVLDQRHAVQPLALALIPQAAQPAC